MLPPARAQACATSCCGQRPPRQGEGLARWVGAQPARAPACSIEGGVQCSRLPKATQRTVLIGGHVTVSGREHWRNRAKGCQTAALPILRPCPTVVLPAASEPNARVLSFRTGAAMNARRGRSSHAPVLAVALHLGAAPLALVLVPPGMRLLPGPLVRVPVLLVAHLFVGGGVERRVWGSAKGQGGLSSA